MSKLNNTTIPGIEYLVDIDKNTLSIQQFKNIRAIRLYYSDDDCHLDLYILTDHGSDRRKMKVQFKGVSNFRAEALGGPHTRIEGFYIESIHDRGWEEKNWKVGDFENDSISWIAREVKILECK